MATKYVDLGKSGSGYSGDDVDNAYSPTDFVSAIASGSDSYLIKGSYEFNVAVVTLAAQTFSPWIPSEPYRMKMNTVGSSVLGGTWSGGIIYFTVDSMFSLVSTNLNSMFINFNNKNLIFAYASTIIKGCNLVALHNLGMVPGTNSINFQDTLVDVQHWSPIV